MSNDPLAAALRRHFGFDSFLDGQEEVVRRICTGEDLCVVMPTGAGKSLCYQLPALQMPGYTLVISPLISLMKDQVDALRAKGIAAACVNSTLTPAERRDAVAGALEGRIKLLYVAPERLRAEEFLAEARRQPPEFVVVDEAHCISQWGHDFRPDYHRIGGFLQDAGVTRVCAFTATATHLVRDDIVRQLGRPAMQAYVTGFKRPNLAFRVLYVGSKKEKLETLQSLLDPPQPTIVYAASRAAVDETAAALGCLRYHAGMEDEERHRTQDRFMQDACPVIVATNAFGMGIDRPDIRRVVHFNIPGSLEAYYQEAGRAGRDGEDAECLLLYSAADRHVHEFLIELNHPPQAIVALTWQALRRAAAENGDPQLELTHAEIHERVGSARGEEQIGAALRILEKSGYVRRGFRRQNRGTLRLLIDPEDLRQRYPAPDSQRAIFARRLLNHYGPHLTAGIACNYEDMGRVTGLKPPQVQRAVHALSEFTWEAPFAGRGVTVLRPEDADLEIDFAEEQARLDHDLGRLRDMLDYPRARDCRQRFLVSYFGEAPGDWRCGVCDLCRAHSQRVRRQLSAAERETALTLLLGVRDLRGRYGRNRIVEYLRGSHSQLVLKDALHHRPFYGALRGQDQGRLLDFLEALREAGCVESSGDRQRPVLRLTPEGHNVLAGTQPLDLNLAALPAPDTAPAPDPQAGLAASDLYERLRQLRNRLAQERGLVPYQLFGNETLRELAERAPQTAAEARGIRGIGPQKERSLLPPFLAEIAAWRAETLGHPPAP